jgi:cytochrome c-type biogenesis protein CcmH/NrfG
MSYYRSRIASNPDYIKLYHQVLTIKPENDVSRWQLGNALVKQNRFHDAIADYQTALQYHGVKRATLQKFTHLAETIW